VTSRVAGRALCGWLALAAIVTATPGRAADSIEIRGMTFVSADPNGRHLVVRAERAHVDPRDEVAWLDDVSVAVTEIAPGFGIHVQCESARVEIRDRGFRLEGRVRGVDDDGRRFATEWLEYDPEGHVLRTDAPVTVVDGASTLRGGAFVYELDERRLLLFDGATVVRSDP